MNIIFKFDSVKWKIEQTESGGQQFDDNTVTIRFEGYFPSQFTSWRALLNYGNFFDEIFLTPVSKGYEAVLSAEQLAFDGAYYIQLKGVGNNITEHSDKHIFVIGKTISGDKKWPEIPTAFSQAVKQAEDAMNEAISAKDDAVLARNDAVIAKEAAESYAEQASIQADYAAGIMGLAVFNINTDTGELIITYPTPYYGAIFAINNSGMLEVTT